MKACLGLHDFSVVNNRLLWLQTLKDYFDDFRVSLFMVPIDEKRDWGPWLLQKDYLAEIKKRLSWIQLIPHGLTHNRSEVQDTTYGTFIDIILPAIDTAFKRKGLPYEKGFCAPHWRWNEDVVRALNDKGWWGAVDRRQPTMFKTKKYYVYSHIINEELPQDRDLKLHGHIFGTPNDLGKCFDNLLKLPKNTEWHYVTDFLEEKI